MSDIIPDEDYPDLDGQFDEPPEEPEEEPTPPREIYLNDFSHRKRPEDGVSDPGNVVIEPTPAQRERVVYLVDQALDVTEAALHAGDWGHKLKAAESILDRAGVAKVHKTETKNTTPAVPAEALTQVIGGLATMFGAMPPKEIKMAEPVKEEPVATKKPQKGKKQGGLPPELLDRM